MQREGEKSGIDPGSNGIAPGAKFKIFAAAAAASRPPPPCLVAAEAAAAAKILRNETKRKVVKGIRNQD